MVRGETLPALPGLGNALLGMGTRELPVKMGSAQGRAVSGQTLFGL